MIQLIKAVVLDSFKFKETSIICNIYTLQYGMMSIMVSGIGKSKSLNGQIYFQPLSIITFSIHYKEKKGILRALDINLIYSPIGIVPDVKKFAISFFIAEIVLKTCKEKEQDNELFLLLESTVQQFEQPDFYDLHLYFLIKYIHLLGFSLKDKEYIIQNSMEYGDSKKINDNLILLVNSDNYISLPINKTDRLIMIKFILQFLEIHLGLSKLKSLPVLEDIFS